MDACNARLEGRLCQAHHMYSSHCCPVELSPSSSPPPSTASFSGVSSTCLYLRVPAAVRTAFMTAPTSGSTDRASGETEGVVGAADAPK